MATDRTFSEMLGTMGVPYRHGLETCALRKKDLIRVRLRARRSIGDQCALLVEVRVGSPQQNRAWMLAIGCAASALLLSFADGVFHGGYFMMNGD
jgi:hypothetical protein